METDNLTIKHYFHGNNTLIENEFIDNYMARANGEYVKVYLFLLRHMNNPCLNLTIATIADCLENTEKDIIRALKYWEKQGLLAIECNGQGAMVGLELIDPTTADSGNAPVTTTEYQPPAAAPVAVPEPVPSIKQYKNRKELKTLLHVAEQYLGKTLSKTDTEAITYFYDALQFSYDLIEYLIEYCVENGHKSIHYIQKVALSWYDKNITTVEEARNASLMYHKNYYTVLKAFGITGRGPAVSEIEYVDRWTGEYGFPLEVITEACLRTINSTAKPTFAYADSILKNWQTQNVKDISDIKNLDEVFQKNKESRRKPAAKPVVKSKFNNFEGRSYDMDDLEKRLLNSK